MPTATLERAEVRAGGRFEIRAADTGDGYRLEGYAATFDQPYEVSDWLGDYVEIIRAGAFKRTLSHGADVRLLINHDGLPLARTKSGTLELTEDDIGLLVRCGLDPASPRVAEVKSGMDRGDIDEMSFQFRVTRQEWSPDYAQRDILEVQLYDVSVVTFPANPTTSVSLRSAAVARYGADVWARIEDSLRTGEPMEGPAREAFTRALSAAGLTVTETPTPEEPHEPAGIDRRTRWAAALLGV